MEGHSCGFHSDRSIHYFVGMKGILDLNVVWCPANSQGVLLVKPNAHVINHKCCYNFDVVMLVDYQDFALSCKKPEKNRHMVHVSLFMIWTHRLLLELQSDRSRHELSNVCLFNNGWPDTIFLLPDTDSDTWTCVSADTEYRSDTSVSYILLCF